MKISSRGRYAVRVMVELKNSSPKVMTVPEISKNQGITVKYLEKVVGLLTKAGLVESTRGVAGGDKLKKDPADYTIAEILRATDDLPELAPCMEQNVVCDKMQTCKSRGCWEKLNELIVNYLNSVKLSDL